MNDEQDSGFHQLNIGHLVMGIALLGLVGVWALWQNEVVTGDDVHWLLPVPWVVAGLVGLAATAVTGQRRYATRQTGWVDAGTSDPQTTEVSTETAPITRADETSGPTSQERS